MPTMSCWWLAAVAVLRLVVVLPARAWAAARARACGVGAGSAAAAEKKGVPEETAGGGASGGGTMVIVLGSGGHTAEMLTLLSGLDCARYGALHFVAAETDDHSIEKARRWCASKWGQQPGGDDAPRSPAHERESSGMGGRRGRPVEFTFQRVTRAREVGQGWLSSAGCTLIAICECLRLVWRASPDIVLVNGPGTCLPVVYAAFLWKFVGRIPSARIVFVESFARVTSLSLTGKLVFPVVDRFVVQWKQQHERIPWGTEYLGRIF